MTFFQKIGNALSRFMYGRNGSDPLNICTIWLAILINAGNLFIRHDNATVFSVLSAVALLLVAWALFRMLSKNLPKRRRENAWFMQKIWNPIRFSTRNRQARAKDKDHKYFTCPSCSAICRVPRGKGKIIITCPRCGGSIHGKT